MCKLLDWDIQENALLLEMISPAVPFDFTKDKIKLATFFENIYQNTITYDKSIALETYWHFYENKVNVACKSSYMKDYRKKCNQRSKYIKQKYFNNTALYYIHGDLHNGNVITNGNKFVAIDPLGLLAPRDFIFARFAAFELLKANNKESMLDNVINFLFNFIDVKKFYMALMIDVDLAILTGIIQLNDNNMMTNQFIKVMNFLEKHFEEYDC